MSFRRTFFLTAALVALWVPSASGQAITEFPVPAGPTRIVAGSDGNLWFGASGDKIVRMTTTGSVTEFALPPHFDMTIYGITAGPDGNVWYVRSRSFLDFERDFGRVGRVTPAGVVTEFSFDETLSGITVGPDGNLWFTGSGLSRIHRMTTGGQLILPSIQVPGPGRFVLGIAKGSDGNVWYTENALNRIGRVTPAGVISEFSIPTPSSLPTAITAGSDGNLWFVEGSGNKISRITPAGVIT
ncbi:MAG: Virginiamycin B lyase, partial [Acidobacteriota bacterium]